MRSADELNCEVELLINSLKWRTSAIRLELAIGAYLDGLVERRYRPDQPRVPAGNPDGGQWTTVGGSGDRARTALAGNLIAQRVGVGDSGLVRHCIYQDMFGRQFTTEVNAALPCRPTYPVPPYFGAI